MGAHCVGFVFVQNRARASCHDGVHYLLPSKPQVEQVVMYATITTGVAMTLAQDRWH